MKKLNLFWLIPFLALSMSLFFTSCEKDNEELQEPVIGELHQLVIDAMTEIPAEWDEEEALANYNVYKEKYNALSKEELFRYYDLQIKEVEKKYENHPNADMAIQGAIDAKEEIMALNKVAIEKFKLNINQLNIEQYQEASLDVYTQFVGEESVVEESAGQRCPTINFHDCMRLLLSTNDGAATSANWVNSSSSETSCNDTEYQGGGRYDVILASTFRAYDRILYKVSWHVNGANYVTSRNTNQYSGWLAGRSVTWGWWRNILRNETRLTQYNLCDLPCICN